MGSANPAQEFDEIFREAVCTSCDVFFCDGPHAEHVDSITHASLTDPDKVQVSKGVGRARAIHAERDKGPISGEFGGLLLGACQHGMAETLIELASG